MNRNLALAPRLLAVAIAVLFVIGPGGTVGLGRETHDWGSRLRALRPEDPMAYFELGEEIADVAEDGEERGLARRLFGIAALLDTDRLGRSACLALADMEENENARRRLLALASFLGSGGIAADASMEMSGGIGRSASPETIVALTEAFSHYRRARGSRAQNALREPGVEDLLHECDPFLPNGSNGFLEDCRRYRGNLRPSLSESDLGRMLRLEEALLAGNDRPWSGELLLGRGRPLIEVDPDRLGETLGIDATHPVYRNGRWVEAGAMRGDAAHAAPETGTPEIITVVMAKRPAPGRVKTRLVKAGLLDAEGAAKLAWALLRCTVDRLHGRTRFVLALDAAGAGGGVDDGEVRRRLGRSDLAIVDQGHGDLGRRLQHVWRAVAPDGPVLFLGADSPDVPDTALDAVAPALRAAPLALGPCSDGGFWALALRTHLPVVLEEIDWGSESVYDQVRRRADAAGIVRATLPSWHDVDRPEDLRALGGRLAERSGDSSGEGRSEPLRRLAEQIEALLDREPS